LIANTISLFEILKEIAKLFLIINKL